MAAIVTVPHPLVGDSAPESQSLVNDHDLEVNNPIGFHFSVPFGREFSKRFLNFIFFCFFLFLFCNHASLSCFFGFSLCAGLRGLPLCGEFEDTKLICFECSCECSCNLEQYNVLRQSLC